jgi:ATP-dependent RNA circularization protein (DNA/RNA ligase family)
MDFFRFPHTPHLAWLGPGQPRGDKVLAPTEAKELLAHELTVEEKVDGANLGFSTDEQGELRAQNRGNFLTREACHPQFKPLFRWLESRRATLADALFPDLMLFGEWCWAVHSVQYTQLPDWFLAFDVYDRSRGEFWSAVRRDEFVRNLGLELVPRMGKGRFSLEELQGLLGRSLLTEAPAEGLYVRWDEGEHLAARAKLVRPEFVQAIEEHWSRRPLRANALASGVPWQ